MSERWVVTGGAGFFGTHLAARLVREGLRPLLLDRAPLDAPELAPHVDFVRADVRDGDAVRRALAGAGVVVHAAAALPRERPRDVWEVSTLGAENVYRAAREAGARACVHLGTTAVYGVPQEPPLTEEAPIAPLGVYGEAKWRAETVARAARSERLSVTVLRPKSFLGTGRLGVFQILFDWVRAGKKIPVLGTGRNRYQLLEVTDLVEAVWLAAHAPGPGDDYNVGAERFGTVAEDVGALCAHAATGARVRPVPAWSAKAALRALERARLSPLYRWVYETCDHESFVDTSKIERALGFRPRSSNAEMLCATYDWYLGEGVARSLHAGGTGHRVAWEQGALRLVRWLS